MRVPVYFKQYGTVKEAGEFVAFLLAEKGLDITEIRVWEQHHLIGIIGEHIRFLPADGMTEKVVFYDGNKDYEFKVWNDRINLFAEVKRQVTNMSCDKVAEEFFERNGISDWRAALDDRADTPVWKVPRFFADRGITGFECMYDCETYMRQVLVSNRIFDALDADSLLFGKAA